MLVDSLCCDKKSADSICEEEDCIITDTYYISGKCPCIASV